MKKKIVLFGAALTALTAFNSCSNENELAQVVEEPVVKGTPFVVNVAGDGTRGTDISSVSAFKLVGIQGTSNKWIDNFVFTKPSNSWVATGHTDLTWPTTDGTHTFYGICDNTNNVTDIENGKFTYTVPTNISEQKDLLVSYVTDAENEVAVTLHFKHALSSVKFKIGFDGAATTSDKSHMHFVVNQITLYNIATNGTFDFANFNGTPWTVSETPGYVNYVIKFKEPFVFSAAADKNSFDAVTSDYIDAEVYVLPQKPTAWDGTATFANSYIGVSFQSYEAWDWTDENYGQYYDDTEDDDYNYDGDENDDSYVACGGKLSKDKYKTDKLISLYAPAAIAAECITLSDLESRTEDAQFEEVYLPLQMANGFGFEKTNTLRIAVDQTRRIKGSKVEAVYKALDIIIE